MVEKTKSPSEEDRLFVDSIEKAFTVMEAFSPRNPDLSLTEICKLTGLNKSAVQRFTHTLNKLGYLDKSAATRRYRLSPKVLESADNFLSVDPLVNRAIPHIVDLRRRVAMRIGLGCLRGDHCMYLVPLQSNLTAFRTANPGFRVPTYCSSTGRALLAHIDPETAREIITNSDRKKQTPFTKTEIEEIMDEIHIVLRQGYCITDNELTLGDINIAAPIRDTSGMAVATITATGGKNVWTEEMLRTEVAPLLIEATQTISATWP